MTDNMTDNLTGPWLYLTEASTADLQGFHQDYDLSVVHCAASVADTTFPQAAIGLLKSLGKNENVTGMRMHPSDGVNVLPIWLAAHQTKTVILSRTQVWQRPGIVTEMVRLLAATTTVVVVATDPSNPGTVADDLIGMCPTPITLADIPTLLPPRPVSTGQEPVAAGTVEVPDSDWGTFRFDCRNAMTADEFARIDDAYVSAVRTARQALKGAPPTDGSTLGLLTDIINTSQDAATATAGFRGTQVAYFQAGYNLRLDPKRLIALYAHTRPPTFTDRDWVALRAYRDPARAATCALYAHGLTVEQIKEFTINDAADLLASSGTGDDALHPHARTFLSVNLIHRGLHGDVDDDPYIPLANINSVLTAAGRDVGVLTGARPVHTSKHTKAIWTAGTGYLLKELS